MQELDPQAFVQHLSRARGGAEQLQLVARLVLVGVGLRFFEVMAAGVPQVVFGAPMCSGPAASSSSRSWCSMCAGHSGGAVGGRGKQGHYEWLIRVCRCCERWRG